MNNTPLVSIIIPTYNRAHLIGETLDSVLAQTYTNWECIIVDDGSTDNTDAVVDEYIKKDSRFKYHHRPKDRPKGGNAARNYGFEVSKGEYVIFLDSDDILEKTCLKVRCDYEIEVNKSQKNICVFKMGIFRYGKKTEQIFNKDYHNEKEYLMNFLITNVPWTITSVFWSREIFEKIGKFDESFQRLQDVEIHIRLLLSGIKIKHINSIDSWYRVLDNLDDYVSDEKLPNVIKSYIKFIDKYYNLDTKELMNTFEVNQYLKELYINIFKKYVLKRKVICLKEMSRLNYKLNLVSKKQFFYINILTIYHKLGFINGYGYSRVRKMAFK